MKYDLTLNENKELTLDEQAKQLMVEAHQLEKLQKALEVKTKEFREELLKAMENNSIDKAELFLNDNLSVEFIYKKAHTRKTVDSNKLKEEGIYDFYTKESNVKSSVQISWKEK